MNNINYKMEENKEYYAFISYKREDEKWEKWLQWIIPNKDTSSNPFSQETSVHN